MHLNALKLIEVFKKKRYMSRSFSKVKKGIRNFNKMDNIYAT
jgi:hypothetical protein